MRNGSRDPFKMEGVYLENSQVEKGMKIIETWAEIGYGLTVFEKLEKYGIWKVRNWQVWFRKCQNSLHLSFLYSSVVMIFEVVWLWVMKPPIGCIHSFYIIFIVRVFNLNVLVEFEVFFSSRFFGCGCGQGCWVGLCVFWGCVWGDVSLGFVFGGVVFLCGLCSWGSFGCRCGLQFRVGPTSFICFYGPSKEKVCLRVFMGLRLGATRQYPKSTQPYRTRITTQSVTQRAV